MNAITITLAKIWNRPARVHGGMVLKVSIVMFWTMILLTANRYNALGTKLINY
jgi:hypothetical protein